MLSIDKIIQQLQQCKDTNITLSSNNESKFTQATFLNIRKSELELLNNNFELLNETNYTMDSELEKLNNNLQSGITKNNKEPYGNKKGGFNKESPVPSKLLKYF